MKNVFVDWLKTSAMNPLKDWTVSNAAQLSIGYLVSNLWSTYAGGISLGTFGVMLEGIGIGVGGFVAAIPAVIYNIWSIMVKSESWLTPYQRSQGINPSTVDKPDLKLGDLVMIVKGYKTVNVKQESWGDAMAEAFWEDDAPRKEWMDINHINVPITEVGVVTQESKKGHMKVQFLHDDRVMDGKGRRRMQVESFIEGVSVDSKNVHGMPPSLAAEFLKHKEFSVFQEVVKEATEYMHSEGQRA